MSDKRDLRSALKQYFGFENFKGDQEKIINSLLQGENVFVIMPTGAGKSLCYQLPALISKGTAIVISPLIALMKNQVDAIRGISIDKGVAHVLNSSLNKSEIKEVVGDVRSGTTKLLYMAPETLAKEEYLHLLKDICVSFFAIDESHCISEWGHDFRPEYRNLRAIIERVGRAPIIGLTATATPKVQEDIQKNLGMGQAKVYRSSFNRPNLYYEVRSKIDVDKQIIKYIKDRPGASGIIYCLSRKKVEEFTQLLCINGINALSYHAGLDAKLRAKRQDIFLAEEAQIIVATIAFGMGIDKSNVRFVIHYDMSKSLESYYQETGRSGRDGGIGECVAFYDYKDIERLKKFMSNKNMAEREIGMQLLEEVVAYAETGISRRKYLLHYFGEDFDMSTGVCSDMDDNVRYPNEKIQATKELSQLLDIVEKTHQRLKTKDLIQVLLGKSNVMIKTHKLFERDFFGAGANKGEVFWKALIRQAIVHNFLKKEIESYGVLKMTLKGQEFLSSPCFFEIFKDHDYSKTQKIIETNPATANQVFDVELLRLLKELTQEIARRNKIPPFAVFQESSLNDMVTQYPITLSELQQIYGVGKGKVRKWGKEFLDLISKYVEENQIIRPEDLVVKQLPNKSTHKVFIIQNVDRKLHLEDIAKARGLNMQELISEMESIVYQGTRLNIAYQLDENFDQEHIDEIFEYFMNARSDKISDALAAFDQEYTEEEMRLLRIHFISEIAN
ncbi:RecQ family ATP-dependent DNA helicase [Bacteroidetes bacterium endosymbiont of Geopemphigus sp.]|uniref:RecQ family ATP-dependent DNA helicase n=1 Tax=Bacteroidetes bacterium endosymbiont of Geopemphigus sp. TaxID=2047937 RepID=UPI000CD2D77B|nr:ATP-dependent DNA helicase RecQ [Bacteroidetes bacterium endosymbiont of Geopemphigus sp.]